MFLYIFKNFRPNHGLRGSKFESMEKEMLIFRGDFFFQSNRRFYNIYKPSKILEVPLEERVEKEVF